MKTKSKTLYLTFDDGPVENITQFVLDELSRYEAKATFFCIGNNAKKHPQICSEIIEKGHKIANHTQNHFKGFSIPSAELTNEIKNCDVNIIKFTQSNLFRPPFGQLTFRQFYEIKKIKKIVFWDVLTYDFASDIPAQLILENAIKNTRSGSIIVFHDNLKSFQNLTFVLPRFIKHFHDLGYIFEVLPE